MWSRFNLLVLIVFSLCVKAVSDDSSFLFKCSLLGSDPTPTAISTAELSAVLALNDNYFGSISALGPSFSPY